MTSPVGALDGVLVVEQAGGVAGTVAAMLLADNGARVIKVEAPAGAPERAHSGHRVWNRGKESVVIDVSRPDGLAELKGLLRRADVLITDQPAGTARDTGMDHAGLAVQNARLITCSISGYGPARELADLPPRDALVSALVGFPSAQPGWLPGPSHIVHAIPSMGAGLLAVQGICAALLARSADGRGRRVDTSLLGGALAMTAHVFADRLPQGATIRRDARGTIPFYGAFECADRRWLQFGCAYPAFVTRAVEAIGITDRVRDPRFGDCYAPAADVADELFEIIAEVIRAKTADEWTAILERADVPFVVAGTTEELLDDPQARVNGIIALDDPEVGPVEQIGHPVRLSGTPGTVRGPAPRLGEHSVAVLAENRAARGRAGAGAPIDVEASPAAAASPAAGTPLVAGVTPPAIPDRPGPLAGLRVLELASMISGPMAGRLLADLGADVVKLEPPEGEIGRRYRSPAFIPLNSGKRDIVVNLRTPEGQAIGHRLAAWADVLIDNMRPGVAERLGMGWEALRGVNPRLVYCHTTAYGSRGPYAQRAGVDPLAAALSGMEMAQGGNLGRPVHLLCYATDHSAALLGCAGILMALVARTRTGEGQRVETSLLDAGALIGSHALARYAGRPPRHDLPRSQYGTSALNHLYETADGWLSLAVETDVEWGAFCRALGRAGLHHDARFATAEARAANDDALALEIGEALRRRSAAEWRSRCQLAAAPAVPVAEGFDRTFHRDPLLSANGHIAEFDHPEHGVVRVVHGWLRLLGSRARCGGRPPLLGEHTALVLTALGYPDAEIERLCEDQVVSIAAAPRLRSGPK